MRDLPSARLKASLFVVQAVAGSNSVPHLAPGVRWLLMARLVEETITDCVGRSLAR